MTSRLRIGIVGANAQRGWAKDAHLAAISALPGLAIHAVSARDAKGADEAARYFNAHKGYADSLEMAAAPDLDIIAITVKVPEHKAIALAALAAGKHVYCEWPLGRDVRECEELAEAARKAGVHAVLGLQGACSPAVRHAAALVAKGAIGEPLHLEVVSPTAGWGPEAPGFYAYLNQRANGATPAAIAGGHTLASMEAVIGPFVELAALGRTRFSSIRIGDTSERVVRDCYDHIVAAGRHESGCLSSLEVACAEAELRFAFKLRGSEGALEISGHHPGGYQVANLTVTTAPPSDPQPAPAAPGLRGGPANVAEIWSRFAHDIQTGAHTLPDFAAAIRLARLVEALDPSPISGGGRT